MRKSALIAAIITISGCNNARSGIEDTVRKSLKDPDSAKFGELYLNPKTEKGCFGVNAKNAFGGYTGEQQAYLQKIDGKWESLFTLDVNQAFCREHFADEQDDEDKPKAN